MVYTGIVQAVGQAGWRGDGFTLHVRAPAGFWSKSQHGDSVAVNGVCLTIEELLLDEEAATFFVMEETRRLTNLSGPSPSSSSASSQEEACAVFSVNLEHSLRFGDSVGGHNVAGHVEGMAPIVGVREKEDASRDVWLDLSAFPAHMKALVVHKGSICLDGVSLTVAELSKDRTILGKSGEKVNDTGNGDTLLMRVSLIRYTLAHTTLHLRKEGDLINVEFDRAAMNEAASDVKEKPATYRKEKYDETKQGDQAEEEWSMDKFYMKQAIALGEKGRYTAPPNPWVACVILDPTGKEIIGRGYHERAGQPHAEVKAIEDAISRGNESKLKGSTVYVTLEPCHHTGRTPPCDKLLVKHSVGRVVVALEDPDTRVSGQGIQLLKEAGIEVTVGVAAKEARASFRSYLHHRSTGGMPYVVTKVAMSIDGKIACKDGTSQWITGPEARTHAHHLRACSQAILVGSRTAIIDRPRLNVRNLPDSTASVSPLRVVLDTRGVVLSGPLLDGEVGPTLLITSELAPESSLAHWRENCKDVEVLVAPLEEIQKEGEEQQQKQQRQPGISLAFVLRELGKRGILQVLVEGGAILQSQMLKEDLINELVVYRGACILGVEAKPWACEDVAKTIQEAAFWRLESVQQLGNDICSVYTKPISSAASSSSS
ncbi:Riboflavin biosynthesis protein RibD [Balamuthia mandrillaris]